MPNYDDQQEQECAGCGKPQYQWQGDEKKGVIGASGETYCCDACAAGTGCTCEASFESKVQSA